MFRSVVDDSNISIHAPVKGATRNRHGQRQNETISIHAPVKGATSHQHAQQIPRIISIHAPVKGATCLIKDYGLFPVDFNPRSREGSDQSQSNASSPSP